MGSILDSGYYTCPGCYSVLKWSKDKVDGHEAVCQKYKNFMKNIKNYREKADKKSDLDSKG